MQQLSKALPGALAELLRTTPLSDGKVTFAWRAAVGPALERVTAVKLDGRVLLVETASAQWSREIMRSSPIILKRLHGFLGPAVVDRIETRTNPNLNL
jgi:Dna[CI] antecedent DciA-like protein